MNWRLFQKLICIRREWVRDIGGRPGFPCEQRDSPVQCSVGSSCSCTGYDGSALQTAVSPNTDFGKQFSVSIGAAQNLSAVPSFTYPAESPPDNARSSLMPHVAYAYRSALPDILSKTALPVPVSEILYLLYVPLAPKFSESLSEKLYVKSIFWNEQSFCLFCTDSGTVFTT